MNKQRTIDFLLAGYRKMSGEKKVLIGMELSETVRKLRRQGAKETKTSYGFNSS